jgi:hypothetical protein
MASPHALEMSPNYLAVVRGIRDLHRLRVAGRDDSSDADAIRDATDEPWQALSDVERKRASGLSEDLYSITESAGERALAITQEAQAGLNEAIRAQEAGDWDRALELLRRWGNHVAPAILSSLRGSIWLAAGDPEMAALFFEHAAKLQPDEGYYRALYVHALHGAEASPR